MAALNVAVYVDGKFRSRKKVCPDIAHGINRCGDRAELLEMEQYDGVKHDVAVFYGFHPILRGVMADYVAAGKQAVHIDLGYWERHWRGDRYGYHRFSINAHHPTAYFQKVKHPQDRADELRLSPAKAWSENGDYILLCGMSEKAADVDGFAFEEWERSAVAQLKAVTDRPIHYRPKPNKWQQYFPIEGTILTPSCRLDDIEVPLRRAWAVVSHHSNAGIDAILAGVPCFQLDGVAVAMAETDLSKIETPRRPSWEERRQWVNDVAYCQFNRVEMRVGIPWLHFKSEGLIP